MLATCMLGNIADMKLFERADFEQAILRATEHFRDRGLRPAIIEKDYYATQALRLIAAAADKIIFKGGASLAIGNRCVRSIHDFAREDRRSDAREGR